MRNTFLGCLLLGTSTVMAQQAATTVGSATGSSPALAPITIVGQQASSNGYGYSYSDGFSDKNYQEKDLKSKEVSKEIAVSKASDIYVENSSRNIVIKTWDQPKVKVTTTVYYYAEGEAKLTDDEWLEKVNLSLKTLGTSVKIKSGTGTGSTVFYNSGSLGGTYSGSVNGVTVITGNNRATASRTNTNVQRILTITVPAGSKLDIESKYSDVSIPAGISDINVDITNGNLETDNLNKIVLRSKYSNANLGDIKNAEVEFSNGRFTAKNVDDLDIESRYSTIEMAAAKKLVMRSTNDEIEMEEAGDIRGRKTYGNLRVTKLNGSLEMDGSNANVKVRKVGPSLSLVKIDNKYADIRIPLRETKNYSVDFTGTYSSVYGNFDKKPVEAKEEKSGTAPAQNAPRAFGVTTTAGALWDNSSTGPSRFTATVGDGKGLKIEMKCPNCTVDFK